MDILEQLYDFNTELTNDARIEIAESIQDMMEAIEGAANMMRGMQFDNSIPKPAKEALRIKMKELDSLESNNVR